MAERSGAVSQTLDAASQSFKDVSAQFLCVYEAVSTFLKQNQPRFLKVIVVNISFILLGGLCECTW